jgi:hypothetical protein
MEWCSVYYIYPVPLKYRYHSMGTLMVESVSKSVRTGRLERELQMVQLSATRCSCTSIWWVSSVSFAAITLCVASQRVVSKVSVYFVIHWVRRLLDTPTYSVTIVMRQNCLSRWTRFLSWLSYWSLWILNVVGGCGDTARYPFLGLDSNCSHIIDMSSLPCVMDHDQYACN